MVIDYKEVINIRRSRRTYINKPLGNSIIKTLNESIKLYNQISGLKMQLVTSNGDAFSGFLKSYGLFSGVQNYIALIGNHSDINAKEKAGYFGEKLVLEATALGLGTCWVGGTFDKKSLSFKLENSQILCCVIALGYVDENVKFFEKLIYSTMHRKSKRIEDFYKSDNPVPEWFINAIKAVKKAPSAINKQPVKFLYGNNKITALVKNMPGFEPIDMGIAKLHFEVGAGFGKWDFGNGSEFHAE